MTLTHAQERKLRTDIQVIRETLELLTDVRAILGDAHLGAALTSQPDTPGSTWATGAPPVGTVSDPTGQSAVADLRTDQLLGELARAMTGGRDAWYHPFKLATQLAARLEPDKGATDWRGDTDLDEENMRAGDCTVCGRHCDGIAKPSRLHTLRSDPPLKACNACRVSWDAQVKRDQGTDIWVWSEARRKHIERTDGRETA